MRARTRSFIAALVGAALVVAGCTSDGADDAEEPAEKALDGVVVVAEPIAPASPDGGALADELTAARAEAALPGVWRPLGEPGPGARITAIAVDPADPARILLAGDVLGVAGSTDGGRLWAPAAGLASFEASRLTFDANRPGTVWVGTMGGPHVSGDGGATWELRRNGFPDAVPWSHSAPIEVVLIDPAREGHLLAFGGSHREYPSPQPPDYAVWESTDDGVSWSRVSEVAGGANVVSAVRLDDASGTLVVAALEEGVFRSTDGGRTWSESSEGLDNRNVRDLVVDPSRPEVLWAAVGAGRPAAGGDDWQPGGIMRSEDGGRTWTAQAQGLSRQAGRDAEHTSRYLTVAISAADPSVLYTADAAWDVNVVYRSADGGASWQPILDQRSRPVTAYSTPVTAEVLAVDPADAERVLLGNAELLLVSDDGGRTWRDLMSHATADGTFVGAGWSGLVASAVAFDPADPSTVALSGYDGANLLLSEDGAASWRRPLVEWDHWGGSHDAAYGGRGESLYVLLGQQNTFNGVALRADGDGAAGAGQWRVASGGPTGLPAAGTTRDGANRLATFADDPRTAIAVIGGLAYRTRDGGDTWQLLEAWTSVTAVAGDPSVPGRLYVADEAGLWVSDAHGDDPAPLPGAPAAITRLTVAPDGTVYGTRWRAEGQAGLFRLRDGRWQQLLDDPYAYAVAVDPHDPEHLLLATNDHPFHDVVLSSGVLRSTDGGATWQPFNDGLTIGRIPAIAFDPATPGRAILGTLGQGFWVIDGMS
ncbi:MAG: hypothetical protein AB7W59_25795 [Acidimicrobiia bacterium]